MIKISEAETSLTLKKGHEVKLVSWTQNVGLRVKPDFIELSDRQWYRAWVMGHFNACNIWTHEFKYVVDNS